MRSNLILVVIVLLVLIGGFLLVSGSNNTATQSAPAPATSAPVEESAGTEGTMEEQKPAEEEAMMESEVKTFEVGGGDFYFDPEEITVTEGDTVKLVFTNEGGTHDFTLDEFSVKTPVLQGTGATAEVEFVADKAGTYEYYCSVNNHREVGMVGTLVVDPKQ